MVKAQSKAINRFRKRLKRRGMARVEVNVRKDDAVLVRNADAFKSGTGTDSAGSVQNLSHFGLS
jgi:hypothetical protein